MSPAAPPPTLPAAEFVSLAAGRGLVPDPDPASPFWKAAPEVRISHEVRGGALKGLATRVRSRWTAEGLHLLFICPYRRLELAPATPGGAENPSLWRHDVVEAFIGTEGGRAASYREFEVSPRGETADLAIDLDRGSYDPVWRSGLRAAARIDARRGVWTAALAIPWSALGLQPRAGARLRINLFRIEGVEPRRRFTAWRPTDSDSFHRPEAFGRLRLEDWSLAPP